jgi:hypothetical protein
LIIYLRDVDEVSVQKIDELAKKNKMSRTAFLKKVVQDFLKTESVGATILSVNQTKLNQQLEKLAELSVTLEREIETKKTT